MFTTVLSSLTSLLPTSFIFSAYVPVLIFGFCNGALLYTYDRSFRAFARAELAAQPALTTAALFVASIVVAYVITSVADFMREFLEGKSLPAWLRHAMRDGRGAVLARALERYEAARAIARELDEGKVQAIFLRLRAAAERGNARPRLVAEIAALRADVAHVFGSAGRAAATAAEAEAVLAEARASLETFALLVRLGRAPGRTERTDVVRPAQFDEVQQRIAELRTAYRKGDVATAERTSTVAAIEARLGDFGEFARRRAASPEDDGNGGATPREIAALRGEIAEFQRHVWRGSIDLAEMQATIASLETMLRTFAHERGDALDLAWSHLLDAIDYARDVASAIELRRLGERNARFGAVATPTALGDVGASIESYTTTRYGIELNTMWSRLQAVLQDGDDKAYQALIVAKTQLDFLLSVTWLAAFTTLLWLPVFGCFGRSWLAFVAIAAGGPAVVWLAYSLAVTNYVSYGMIVRACVDINRFALLERLHLRRPTSVREERRIWQTLRRLSSFGSGESEVSYEPEKPRAS